MNWKTNPEPNGVTAYYTMHYVQPLIPLINYSVDIEYSIKLVDGDEEPKYAAYAKQKIFDRENEGLLFVSPILGEAMDYCEHHTYDITNKMIEDINKIFNQFQFNVKTYYEKNGNPNENPFDIVFGQKIKQKIAKIMEGHGI